eukprot:GEZU01008383.1.p1 GENE.GEZU01008383.1~~GEZU01008383.1.p1  ORF type:complete len:176 (-),score=37.00 GEZU01008383.1:220-747(-)
MRSCLSPSASYSSARTRRTIAATRAKKKRRAARVDFISIYLSIKQVLLSFLNIVSRSGTERMDATTISPRPLRSASAPITMSPRSACSGFPSPYIDPNGYFESLYQNLKNFGSDIILSRVIITPERAALVDFSCSYLHIQKSILRGSLEPEKNLTTLEQLNAPGIKVAVTKGSIY